MDETAGVDWNRIVRGDSGSLLDDFDYGCPIYGDEDREFTTEEGEGD